MSSSLAKMLIAEIQRALEPHGFVAMPGFLSQFQISCSFTGPKVGRFTIVATAGLQDARAEHLDLGLKENPAGSTVGTIHRVGSIATLEARLSDIIAGLQRVALQEELLKCPECGIRWVHVKEPTATTKKFSPFLSCSGMTKTGKRLDKHVICRGVSDRIPAITWYG
jgi:hypothetical protein